MNVKKPVPGINRAQRISHEGLERLEKQLTHGVRVNVPVLAQWIRRYGEPARELIRRYGLYCDELDKI